MKGISISSVNGEINWIKIKEEYVDCVYIKSSEGDIPCDSAMEKNYIEAGKNGIFTGFYHVLNGACEPEIQAENFYKNIKGKENFLIPCVEVKYDVNDPEYFMEYVLRFIERFKVLSGIEPCIKTSPSFADKELYSWLKRYPLWSVSHGRKLPKKNKVWGNLYVGHEYWVSDEMKGLQGTVSISRFNMGIFNGKPVVRPAS